jgi:hypothetical protein
MNMYDEGEGVPVNHLESVRWLRVGAGKGNSYLQWILGMKLASGFYELRQNEREAVYWFRKAADQGHSGAQDELGERHYEGRAVLQDYGEAASWFRKSAEQGDDFGQHRLGLMYAKGEGVPLDYVEAYMWLNLAAAEAPAGPYRDERAKERELVAQKMTPQQIAEGQRRAREWNPKGWGWKFPYRDRPR